MPPSITWLGHSAFRLVLPDERVVYIDPWLAENPSCPDGEKKPRRCDIVLITHGHFDHTGDIAQLIEQFNPTIVGNYDLCEALSKRIGTGRFAAMNTGGTQDIKGVKVSLTMALHSSGLDSPTGPQYAGMPNGMVVAAPGVATLYHAGDTDVFGDMAIIAELYEPKIAILPIGDLFTMGAKGAAIAAKLLKPAAIIPCHYKTFPILAQSADDFRTALPAELRPRLHTPNAGESVRWTATGVS